MSENIALAGRIRESIAELENVVTRTVHLAEKALQSNDDDYWDGVALNLHGFYTGVERIFEDIARTIDESLPEGADWHRDLLLQISAQETGVRPAVITRDTRTCLDEYRGFRHVVRSVYTFSLRPSRMKELVEGLAACFMMVSRDLNQFATFLESLDQDD
jgi:hypothetical protein